MDPVDVQHPGDLAECLDELRGRRGLSLAAVEAATARLPATAGRSPRLSKSTVGDMCTGRSVPSDASLLTFLTVCRVAVADLPLWLAAAARARTAGADRPRGARRVRDSDPRDLGVHAAIRVDGAPGELPTYVPRDIDERLRSTIRDGVAGRGTFVLLLGDSSVGKTRCAYEAVTAELGDWWLFHPGDASALDDFAGAATPRTVVWLDEIQQYLDGGLTAATVRSLRNARGPVVVVGTLWPEFYHRIIALPDDTGDAYARHRELIHLATVIAVGTRLSGPERRRAETAAAVDARLAECLVSPYGMTQALAAAPELVRRWEAPSDCYAWALITAAVDARRLGVRSPLSADLLRAAVPGYLDERQRAKAPANWFERALAYATEEVHGAVSALAPVAAEMGVVTGYTVADYLRQYGGRTRRTDVPPASAWAAYLDHLTDGADRLAAATSAYLRSLHGPAENLYRTAIGEPYARSGLAGLLHQLGRSDEAVRVRREALVAGEPGARSGLARSLLRLGDGTAAVQAWRDAVAAGEPFARSGLAGALQRLGDRDAALEAWQDAATAGEPGAGSGLARLLQQAGRTDRAASAWRHAVAAGEPGARSGLAASLHHAGTEADAEGAWRDAVAAGDLGARLGLSRFLEHAGRGAEAEQAWRDAVLAGESGARSGLARLLQQLDRVGEVEQVRRDAVAAGEPGALSALAAYLSRTGRDADALRAHRDAVAAGEDGARSALARMLRRLGRHHDAEQAWRDAVLAGEPIARFGLAGQLQETGRDDDAEQVRREAVAVGEVGARSALARMLHQLGRTDEAERAWRDAVAAGETGARSALARMLHQLGRTDEAERAWRDAVQAGEPLARSGLAELLDHLGRADEARQMRRDADAAGERGSPFGSVGRPRPPGADEL